MTPYASAHPNTVIFVDRFVLIFPEANPVTRRSETEIMPNGQPTVRFADMLHFLTLMNVGTDHAFELHRETIEGDPCCLPACSEQKANMLRFVRGPSKVHSCGKGCP